MMPRYYNEYANTVGDSKPYNKEKDGVFYSEDPMIIAAAPITITECSFPDAIAVDDCAFSDCRELQKVNFPNVRYIGQWAFSYCKSLKNITLSQVVVMRAGAFCGSGGIEYADLSSLVNIPFAAFSNCTGLKSVKLCDDLRSIGDDAFCRCQQLKEISIPKGLKQLGQYSLFGTAIEQITIPKGIKQLPDGVFAFCGNLSSVTIPQRSVESIGDCAFLGCKSLKTIYLPRCVRKIHESAFDSTPLETVICHQNSYAERWAKENGYATEV